MRWKLLRAFLVVVLCANAGIAKLHKRVTFSDGGRPDGANGSTVHKGSAKRKRKRSAPASTGTISKAEHNLFMRQQRTDLNFPPLFAAINRSDIQQNIRQFDTNPSSKARPIIHLCALFALRFEAPYLLPWIAHHANYGVDHFHLYMDDASPSWSDDLLVVHAHTLALLRGSDKVTLYSMKQHGIKGQEGQVEHCVVNTVSSADWVGNWDLDESLSSQTYGSGTPGMPGVLKRVLQALPKTALGVTIPRNDLYTRAKHSDEGELPFLKDELEYEQYTVRLRTDPKGKSLWRTGAHVFPMPLAGHFMMAPDSLKHTVVTPDGTSIANGTVDRMEYTCHACYTPSRITFLVMQHGVASQVAVLKESTVSVGHKANYTQRTRKRHRKKNRNRTLPDHDRQERDVQSQGSRARSAMHAGMLARWEVGSKAANDENTTRTWEFTNKEQTGLNANNVPRTEKLPSWVGVLALNHYQRSYGECMRKADFMRETGGIFADRKFLHRTRANTLLKRCTEHRSTRVGVDDTTVANVVPRIWEKLVELFGNGAKEHQYHVQRAYRQHVFGFLNHTEAFDF